MIDMTREEKARAYDEALKDMRALYPNLKGDAKLAVGHAFPELRESEDERIRKAIVLGIKRCADAGSIFGTVINNEGVNYHDVLAYLEKQKEQKPVDTSDFKTKLAEYLQNNSPKDGKYVISSESILEMAEEELLKRGVVQKPAEWSEEDEKNCNRIIRFLEPHKTFFPTKETKEEMQNWLKNRLKSIRPSWKPSEEQMEALKDAVRLFKETHFEKFHYKIESLYEQLKKLI